MKTIIRLFFSLILVILYQGCSSSGTDQEIPEIMQMPEAGPDPPAEAEMRSALMGEFMNGAHITMGNATVNKERSELQLTNFKSESGPILNLYLATDGQATDYIDLGELKGLEGNFEYALPSNVDFETHNYLIVWCVDFSVNFGYAILE